MRVSLVVAAARNSVIGQHGAIPWHLRDDQRFFKQLTTGHCVIMGRKTFESLPRPLPNRTTIVLSRQVRDFGHEVESARNLEAAIDSARTAGFDECFIAGGEAVYNEGLLIADRIYLTRVDAEPEGDTFFPELEEDRWQCVESAPHPIDDRHAFSFTFEIWDRTEAPTR